MTGAMNLFGFLRKIFRGKKGRNPRATSPNRAAPTPKSVAASARSKKNEYKIQGTLGEGTYGVVKMCEHVPTGMKYAAKIIQKKYLKEHRFQDLVHKEVAVLRKIRHENIVSLVEFFETPETYYLIFELATGGELFDKILEIHDSQAEQGSFTEREAAVIIATVTNALAYLHDLGIVHRDIKPENLLFKTKDASSPLTIVDFGISQVIQGDRSLLTTVCGSPGYTAPEVLRRHPYDTKVDIFALGAVTYSLLVGYGPFAEAPDMVALSDRVVTGNYQFDSPTWDPISGLAKDFIRQCLSVSPNHRPTAHTLLRHPWIVKFTPMGYLEYLRQLNMDAHRSSNPEWTPTEEYTVSIPLRQPSTKVSRRSPSTKSTSVDSLSSVPRSTLLHHNSDLTVSSAVSGVTRHPSTRPKLVTPDSVSVSSFPSLQSGAPSSPIRGKLLPHNSDSSIFSSTTSPVSTTSPLTLPPLNADDDETGQESTEAMAPVSESTLDGPESLARTPAPLSTTTTLSRLASISPSLENGDTEQEEFTYPLNFSSEYSEPSIHQTTLSRDSIRRAGLLGVVVQADLDDIPVDKDAVQLPDLAVRFATNRRSVKEKAKIMPRALDVIGESDGEAILGGERVSEPSFVASNITQDAHALPGRAPVSTGLGA